MACLLVIFVIAGHLYKLKFGCKIQVLFLSTSRYIYLYIYQDTFINLYICSQQKTNAKKQIHVYLPSPSKKCSRYKHITQHDCVSVTVCMCERIYEGVCQRQRGLSAGHWLYAYQFAVISLAWLSSVRCQLSKGLLRACPLMRGCSHALGSIQHSNRSRMAAQGLPIALDWRRTRRGAGKR